LRLGLLLNPLLLLLRVWLRLGRRTTPFDLRSRLLHRLLARSRHHARLALLPLDLHVRLSPALRFRPHNLRPYRLWLWRRPLAPVGFTGLRFAFYTRLPQLLIINRLLTGRFALGSLLLAHQLPLVLRRLADLLALSLLIGYAINSSMLQLLTLRLLIGRALL
jgi:hypothetical protein